MIKLYTDATKGNPGPTGLGMLVVKTTSGSLKLFATGFQSSRRICRGD